MYFYLSIGILFTVNFYSHLYVENWFYFDIICSKWQILTIGIFLYQDVYLNIFNWYQDFICFLAIGINALFTFYWYMFTFNWYQNVLHWHIFNWYHYWLYPLLISFFLTKRENIFLFYSTLCWWLTKRGRIIWVYMHVSMIMHVFIMVSSIWYQEYLF